MFEDGTVTVASLQCLKQYIFAAMGLHMRKKKIMQNDSPRGYLEKIEHVLVECGIAELV